MAHPSHAETVKIVGIVRGMEPILTKTARLLIELEPIPSPPGFEVFQSMNLFYFVILYDRTFGLPPGCPLACNGIN
jgi:hypothetical protein